MMRTIRIALFLLLALPTIAASAQVNGTGTCTIGVPIGSSSCTQVFAAKDVAGGRHYVLLQCVGANNCYCAIGTNGQGTANAGLSTDGIQVGPNGLSWVLGAFPAGPVNIPLGDVCCRTASSTSEIIGCDF